MVAPNINGFSYHVSEYLRGSDSNDNTERKKSSKKLFNHVGYKERKMENKYEV